MTIGQNRLKQVGFQGRRAKGERNSKLKGKNELKAQRAKGEKGESVQLKLKERYYLSRLHLLNKAIIMPMRSTACRCAAVECRGLSGDMNRRRGLGNILLDYEFIRAG